MIHRLRLPHQCIRTLRRYNASISPELNQLLQQTIDATTNAAQPQESGPSSRVEFEDDGDEAPMSELAIASERQLFYNIFKLYMQEHPEREAQAGVAGTVAALLERTKKAKTVAKRVKTARERISSDLKQGLESSTLQAISKLPHVGEVCRWFFADLDRWKKMVSDAKLKRDQRALTLDHLLKPGAETEAELFVNSVIAEAEANPTTPPLNAFTLPIVINGLIKMAAFELHDGQTAMTLYHWLKRDVNVYSVACNQETHNLVLAIAHLYYGKGDLYPVEALYHEMRNSGFSGNMETFNVLKQVVIDYYGLRMGKLDGVNATTLVPLWLKEDDVRAESFERHLKQLARRLTH